MLTELIELDHKIKEGMKAIHNKIKQNIQGTNGEGKETGTQINDLEQKEERNVQPELNEEKRILKNEEITLGQLQALQCLNHRGARRRRGRARN